MKRNLLLMVLFLLVTQLQAMAQSERNCAAMDLLELQLSQDPDMANRMEAIERHTEEFIASGAQENSRAVTTIPVIFHIIHNGDAVGSGENISDAYIMAQLDQLNKDFRKMNSDASLIPSIFAGVAADSEVEFCLAQRTPTGAATTGIERLNKGQASWTMNQIESSLKPTTIWDRNKYLNLWTVVFGGGDAGLLGYAQFPGGSASTDGVVVLHSSVGSVSTPNPGGGVYGKGRTLTHEVGHWLNLRHIWGDATCGNDQVSDTPTHNTANYGCPSYPHYSTCSGSPVEMTMNYMDYTDDGCMYMFTAGQKARMQALFAGGSRASLATSDGCTPPGGGGGGTTCGIPSGLNTSSITQTSATLGWNAVSGADSYNVQARQIGASTWASGSTTGTSINYTGLTCGNNYEFQVEAVCGTTTSGFSASNNFSAAACTVSCGNDSYESNDTFSAAKSISTSGTKYGLICGAGDEDWFKFNNTSSNKHVKVTLFSLPLDYDMQLYSSSGTLLATSENGGTSNETIIYNYGYVGTYYVRVYGYGGATHPTDTYALQARKSKSPYSGKLSADAAFEMEELALELIPNPATDMVTLFAPSMTDADASLRIFDVTGRLVMQMSIAPQDGEISTDVDVSQLVKGYYIVELQSGEERVHTKLAIVR